MRRWRYSGIVVGVVGGAILFGALMALQYRIVDHDSWGSSVRSGLQAVVGWILIMVVYEVWRIRRDRRDHSELV